jgi:hypothetical protein
MFVIGLLLELHPVSLGAIIAAPATAPICFNASRLVIPFDMRERIHEPGMWLPVISVTVLLSACHGMVGAATGDAATPDAPADAAAATADASADGPPLPRGPGWIGSRCAAPTDCDVPDGMCLADGFPGGLCTRECALRCPDRAGTPTTFCVDGRPFGFDEGLCVSRCSTPSDCAPGWQCAPRNRYAEPTTVTTACVPAPAPGTCDGPDELVDIAYPDFGEVWIPHEAQCGGAFPLVVLLHGINPSQNPTPSLGGGRHLEVVVRALVDAGAARPVILAEPVQTEDAATSTGLYAPQHFDPATHLDKVAAELHRRGITIATLSYAGHSGSGCDPGNGLYLVLARLGELVPAYAPTLRMWATEDICYVGDYAFQAPLAALGGKGDVLVNMTSTGGDPTTFEDGLFPAPQPLACAGVLYSSCIRHATETWCSYRTRAAAGIDHENNPFFFVREAFPQVFAADGAVAPCR